ncbi:hypothetical protein CERSUDRAFT_71849 [Gelatoporia subvermispora B]|uniref:Uncharacterized protein n=1 Tax=Ceriporiopsis subvermispora (strain B) TaxID=914234 RepID=M2PTK9_CERS8|nr:hypothetical protein CERSUDRAFT_71849 [Gelatoporia subvermispora B]
MQHLEAQANAKKLKTDTKEDLRKFIMASESEREVMRMALWLQIRDLLIAFTMVFESSWQIPPGVDKNLNKYAIRLLLSPNLAHYDNDLVVKILMGITERKLWGLSPTMRTDDDGKWDRFEARARELLGQRKSEIKKLVVGSVDPTARAHRKKSAGNKDWHIAELCQHLIGIGIKSVKTNLVVTKAMCVRIAFLRQVLSDHGNTANYWPDVDNELEKVRAREKDGKKRSKLFLAVLTADVQCYPGANMAAVEKARESMVQGEVAEIITNQDFSHLEPEQADDSEE